MFSGRKSDSGKGVFPGRIDADLGGNPPRRVLLQNILGRLRRVQLDRGHAWHDEDISLGLYAKGHGPIDHAEISNIDIVIHDYSDLPELRRKAPRRARDDPRLGGMVFLIAMTR